MQLKERFWEIVFYISISIVILWAILKSAGVFNTPLWLEFGVPILSAAGSLLSLFIYLMNSANKIFVSLATLTTKMNFMEHEVGQLKSGVSQLNFKVNHIETDLDWLKKDLEYIKKSKC